MNQDIAPEIRPKLSGKRLAPVMILLVGLATTFSFDLHHYLSFESLRENREMIVSWQEHNLAIAAILFMAAYCGAIAISLPGAIWLTILGGFIFGTVQGGLFVVVGATLGATIIFLAARYAFADYFYSRVGSSLKKMEDGFRRNALSYLLFLRLVPAFPFWLVNLVPALAGVSLRAYVVATVIGIIPGTFVYASLGSGLGHLIDAGQSPNLKLIFSPEIIVPLIALALLSLVPVIYKNRHALRGRLRSVPKIRP